MRHRTTHIGRRAIAALIWAAALCAPASDAADQAPRDVLIVRSGDAEAYQQAADAAADRLSRGGRRVRDVLLSDLKPAALTGAGAPEALLAVGSEAAATLNEAAPPSTLLVYCLVADPARARLLDQSNIHGVSTDIDPTRQVEIIEDVLPGFRVVGALYKSGAPSTRASVDALRAALPRGWRLEAVDIDAHPSVAAAIDEVFSRGVDLLWTSPEREIYDQATVRQALLTSLRKKIPVFGFSASFVRAGALLGVSVNPGDQGRQAAALLLEKLPEGADADHSPPGDEPTHVKANPRFALNAAVAEQLGVRIRSGVRAAADQIFGDQ